MTTATTDRRQLIEPTWEGLLPAFLAVLEDGTPTGRQIAREELRRMARAADLWNTRTRAAEDRERCDECGADVTEDTDMVSARHTAACSLHPDNVTP